VVSDFDGDGKTDVSVVTPASGLWSVELSSSSAVTYGQWGNGSDIVAPGDSTVTAIGFRGFQASTGTWYIYGSEETC
jgi:hypothetical protein